MTEVAKKVPNPGSPEARELSCTCPVLDNHHGEGFIMNGERVWWRASGCPLHDPREERGEGD